MGNKAPVRLAVSAVPRMRDTLFTNEPSLFLARSWFIVEHSISSRPSEHIDMLRLPIVALFTLLMLSSATFAADRKQDLDLPSPDRPGTWRWMTQDPETTTSRCVGETKTPLCTIETFLACRIRADLELCRIAAVEDEYGNYSLHRDVYTRYRVAHVIQWDERNLGRRPWRPLDRCAEMGLRPAQQHGPGST
jgi:hypothetical protein